MTFVHRPTTRKRAQTVANLPPIPTLSPAEKQHSEARQALTQHTARPVAAQRQAVQAPLRAATLDRQEVQRLQRERQEVQAHLEVLPTGSERPPAPVVRHIPVKPATPDEWVTVLRHRAGEIGGERLDSRAFVAFQTLQRQVAQQLAQSFRADRGDVQVRYATYGEQLATLQRHALSAPVARVVLGMVPPVERPPLQRATDEALQRLQAQESAALYFETAQSLQRQLAELDAETAQPVLARIQARRGGGNPLPDAIRRHLERGLNHDLSRVRIHDDAEADKLAKGVNAVAFTTGADIFFRAGHFNPNTQSGLELLAHEVTHTVQQSQGRVGGGIDPDAGLEVEARAMGAKLAQVMPSPKSLMPPVAHRSGPHAPGVYSQKAALGRVQAGAARHLSLKPLLDLQPRGWQRSTDDLTVQRFDLSSLNPVTAIKNGAAAIVNKGKDLIASGLSRLPGYRELCLAFGRDLVTGQTISGSADSILTALTNWVPGPLKDILRALRETRVVDKAWQWFQGQLSKLNLSGVLGEVAGAVQAADLGKARSAVTSRISGVKSLILGCADHIAGIAMTALTAGLGPLGKTIMAGLRGAKGSVVQILKNPALFARNLVEAVKGGFKQFSTNAPKHLQRGVGQWLTGSTGISFPAKFDLQGVFLTALSVMGLTYQAMRGKLVKALGAGGAQKVSAAERTVEVLQSLKGGLDKAQEMKAEQGSAGKAVQDGIKTEVTNSLVLAGIQKIVTMLVPGGGLISAIIGAFQTVQVVVQQAAQIGRVITSGLSSVAAIAAGNISGAVGAIDRTLGGMIPIALTWLGKVAGLGNFGSKVKAVIQKVRGRLDRVVDKIVAKVKGLIEKLTGKSKGKRPESVRDQADGTYGVVKFTAGKERHSVWTEIKSNQPRIMIASTPMNAIAQLQNFKKEAVAVGAEKGLAGHFQQAGQEVGKGLSILKKSATSNDFNVKNRLNEQALTTNNRIARYGEVIRSVTQQAKLNPPRMHRVDIAFTTGSFPEQKREFLLQLREQEAGLNAMTIASWEKNRSAFVARFIATGSGRDTTVANRAQRTSTRLSKAALIDDLAANIMANDPSITLKEARKKAAPHAETWIQQQRPLHNPDQVAGGEPAPAHPMAMGGKDVNGSIGPQWKTRIGQLDSEVAAYKASYPGVDCKKVNVNVRLTLS